MLQLAEQFATLLDQNRFDDAGELLAEDCRYSYSEGKYQGRKNIVNVFRQNAAFSAKTFDEIKYSSEVEPIGADQFAVHFFDTIRMGEAWHEHQFYNIVTIRSGKIVDIEHRDVPGQNESLREFFHSQSSGSRRGA